MTANIIEAVAAGRGTRCSGEAGGCCSECDVKDETISQLEAQVAALRLERAIDTQPHDLPGPSLVVEGTSPSITVVTCVPHGVFQLDLPTLFAKRDAEVQAGVRGPVTGGGDWVSQHQSTLTRPWGQPSRRDVRRPFDGRRCVATPVCWC